MCFLLGDRLDGHGDVGVADRRTAGPSWRSVHEVELYGERLAGDQAAVGLELLARRWRRGHGQTDSVADRETAVAASLLHGADEVAGGALGLELGIERRVEHDDTDVARQRSRSRALGGVAADHAQRVLP